MKKTKIELSLMYKKPVESGLTEDPWQLEHKTVTKTGWDTYNYAHNVDEIKLTNYWVEAWDSVLGKSALSPNKNETMASFKDFSRHTEKTWLKSKRDVPVYHTRFFLEETLYK